MATLIIKRNSSINLAASRFNIYLDDKVVGKIGNGKTVELEVADGDYALKIGLNPKSNCSNSIAITLKSDETRSFEVGYPKGIFAKQMLSLLFLMLIILPGTISFSMPHKPAGAGIVSALIAIVGVIGYFWMQKKQKGIKQKSGLHLNEMVP
ncbi:hypothetical protein [Bartonella sp. HY761]|uniref:hypothetical protein n=1 Tax=Bartonella sp. HY761 TaxID=2979330 RepID=UPI002202A836|nr:hypothetical protein [Bartonella sp. HY761]UXN06234.1 hypothetical protein N6A79_13335 [Bartonella sp. HY761]